MQNLLLELQQISTKLYELTVADSDTLNKTKKINWSKPPKLDVFPVINLEVPTPDSLVFELVRLGTPRTVAQELVEIRTRLVSELAAHLKRIYHEECLSVLNACNGNDNNNNDFVRRSKIYSHLQHASHRLFIQRTQTWEKDLVEICRDYYAVQHVPSDIPQKKNSRFKLDFIPALEKVFKRNRFPSSAVKRVLAEKSGMSVKQIKDWFQNHRNRSKVSPNSDSSSPTNTSEVSSTESTFSIESPSYAYPTRYSPLITRERDFTVFRNTNYWPRKPSNSFMKHQDSNVDIDSLISDFEKMRIGVLSLKLKDVTRRLKSHIKRRSTYGATFPYTIPHPHVPLFSASKGATSTLQEKQRRALCGKKSSKKSGFFRTCRRVPGLDFGDGSATSYPDGVETATIENEGTKDQSSSFVESAAYSLTPSSSKNEFYSSPILSNVSSRSLLNLTSDTHTELNSDSLSSTIDKLSNSVIFYPYFSLGKPFNIISAHDILPAMPKFSDSIDSISVDFFSLRNLQNPIITF